MNVHTEPQIIRQKGRPVFAVIPWEEYQNLLQNKGDQEVWFPNEVVKANARGISLTKAWREYHGLTQAELAEAAAMKQPALARLENSSSTPRAATRERLAKALGITPEQLVEE